jgi:1-acyl-sn-glycerol-3-phosphate acyltransferase
MAKSELMRVPVLGWLLAKAGVFGVDRGKSDVGAIKQALKVLKGGERLMLFPEGTRFKEGDGGAAKTGAAMLALRTGVPIVPVYIPREKKWLMRTPVIIGEPYYPGVKGQRATPEDYRAVADDLMARIHALGEQIKV